MLHLVQCDGFLLSNCSLTLNKLFMKKNLLLILLLGNFQVFSLTHVVSVSNFQFSPANLNVVVGDVIRWQWVSGFHNSESLFVPAGASDWVSQNLTGTGNFYEYTITTPGNYQYYCGIHGLGMSGSFTASPVVPVKLSAFTVTGRANRPFLSWTTQSETNADYFSIRRSLDGNSFTEISKVPAAGNSTIEKNYSFTDIGFSGSEKYVFYEIAVTDKDGKVQLSPIKLFKRTVTVSKIITSISPNPVSEAGHLMIKFNADATGVLIARITDMTGKMVLVSELSATPGVNKGHIHLGDLGSGNYVVQFNLNGVTETYKLRKK